ncbi:MAG: hypothetical protein K2J70_06785 [Muribaculaceae bacterium]|nr:hypothetical protein [Muribaculaceae bacterium]
MTPAAIDACRLDLYTAEEELRQKYPQTIADKVLRCRAMHQWFLANPEAKDAAFIREDISRHNISKPSAYSDLATVKTLLPLLSESSREFHRWRFGEMILKTFEMAERRKDARTMEKAAATYAKYYAVDREDEKAIPVDQLIPQPFVATDDPTVLGLKPIPNLRQKIRSLVDKYAGESEDIKDIQFEEIDLRENEFFDEA